MGLMVRMRNPQTKKIEMHSPQNALDLEQHNDWKRLGVVEVKDNYIAKSQDVLDGTNRRKNAAQGSLGPTDTADAGEADESDEAANALNASDPEDKEPDDSEIGDKA
jgi:hypothetical protein